MRRRQPLLSITLVLVLAVALFIVLQARASGGQGGSILLLSDRQGDSPNSDLYAIDADGRGLKRLLGGDVLQAQWSPDGKRIAFTRAYGSIYLVRANGRGLKQLVSGGVAADYSWAPDSRRIAYSESAGPVSRISIANAVTGARRGLTTPPPGSFDFAPVWSPDGRRIAFLRAGQPYCGGGCSLYVVNADGSGERQVASDAYRPASWSPDGKRFVFEQVGVGLVITNADGSSKRRLAVNFSVLSFAWSPRGDEIALVGYTYTGAGVWVVRPNGTGLRNVFPRERNNIPDRAVWSPDGTRLAVTVATSPLEPLESDVWVVEVANRSARRITQGVRYGYANVGLQWQPHGLDTAHLAGKRVTPAVPTDSIAVGRMLRTRNVVEQLAADGDRVVAAYAKERDCIESWNPVSHLLVRFHQLCEHILSLGIAGANVAWADFDHAAGVNFFSLETATLARPATKLADLCLYPPRAPVPCQTATVALQGQGRLLAFESFGAGSECFYLPFPGCPLPKRDGKLWRLEGSHAVQIASSTGALTPLSVDAGRILVDHEDGTLALYAADGTLKHSYSLGALPTGAALGGNDLVVLRPGAVDDLDADTGALRHTWPLPAPDATLAGVQHGIAAYVSGTDVHLLRLADGSDTVVHAGPNLHAQLTSAGLFYSYTVSDSERSGRVAFVPAASLP